MPKANPVKPTPYAVVFFAKVPMESLGTGFTSVLAAMPPELVEEISATLGGAKAPRKPKVKAKKSAPKK